MIDQPYHDKDLSQLPAPEVLKKLSYEALITERKQTLNGLRPLVLIDGQPVLKQATLIQTDTESYWKIPADQEAGLYYLDLSSDPATRIIEADTYGELLLHNAHNQLAKDFLIAYATGANLDHLAANYGVSRLVISPATTNLAAVLESDAALRKRTLLMIENYARGGSMGWYLFNTLSASGLVKDAAVISPNPCEIVISVLSHERDGTATPDLLAAVEDYIHSRYTRVLGDLVTVQSAEILHYELTAEVAYYPGPSSAAVKAAIETAWMNYRSQSERIGHGIHRSAIDAALHQPGVYRASIQTPANLPLAVGVMQAPYCDSFTLVEATL
jgi:phage-related baseplate assembly protein